MNPLRQEVVGADVLTPLLDGSTAKYVNFDNAASTPTLKRVLDKINEFMPYYSSVHRGAGYKSRLSTHLYDRAHELAGEFVGYNPKHHVVIMGKNATEAINKLSYRLDYPENAAIIISEMEHHSNDLPWRDKADAHFAPVSPIDGRLNLDALAKMIDALRGRLFLVTVSGASNVTGNLNDLPRIAEMVHAAGAYLMVDGAQLVPHRSVQMGLPGDEHAIDFLAYSAHKMYAPYGTGVLIARGDLLKHSAGPEYRGGGTVKIVTHQQVFWADDPEIDEAGSPNVVGAIALGEAIRFFLEKGFDKIEETENKLAAHLLEELLKMPEIDVYGMKDPSNFKDRLAVIPFNVKGMPHALVSAILAYEHGIGVRTGCFCAHPYIKLLMNVFGEDEKMLIKAVLENDRSQIPGAVRASFGFYNDAEEVERLLDAVKRVVGGEKKGEYAVECKSGEYYPLAYKDKFSQTLEL